MLFWSRVLTALLVVLAGCAAPPDPGNDAAVDPMADGGLDAFVPVGDGGGPGSDTGVDAASPGSDAGPGLDGGGSGCATAAACEQHASDQLDALAAGADHDALVAFLTAVPKGGDLHNHLSGAVYAETYLEWGRADGDCVDSTTFSAVYRSSCSTSTMPAPSPGSTFFDQVVRAWSMEGFVPGGAETGHDHFFATFGKYGAIAGAHRYDSIADVASRAASENAVYVETMFNLGTNVGGLAASTWSGTVTPSSLPTFYSMLTSAPTFASELAMDVSTLRAARDGYRTALGCSGASPPAACGVRVRFVAQVSRTGNNDQIFGQLVSAFEMARMAPEIVGVNLSSPEDDTRSINNYDLHMAMLDFLHQQYTVPGTSPLHVTLHAGELTSAFLPSGSTANTFHIRHAVETGHAERIGHGIDVLSETDPTGLMAEMASGGVLVEVCLSSNDQILEVSGTAHPMRAYMAAGVPVALATDDQGVSRSSLAGEYVRGVTDQHLTYRELKRLARDSLEHSFLPGASLWSAIDTAMPVAACDPITDAPSAGCQAFLDASERATAQYELERRYLVFERSLP